MKIKKFLWSVFFILVCNPMVHAECAFTGDTTGGQEGLLNDAGICIDMVHRQAYRLTVECLDREFNVVIWDGQPQVGDFIDTLGCNAIRVKVYTKRQRSSEELFTGCVVNYSLVAYKNGHQTRPGPLSENHDWDFSLFGKDIGSCNQSANLNAYRVTPISGKMQKKEADNDRSFVSSLYRSILDREPDDPGLRHWIGWLKKGKSRHWVMERFFASQEYESRGKSDREFIRDFYQATQSREPNNQEMSAAIKQLSQSGSRIDFLTKSAYKKTEAHKDYRNSGTHFSCKNKDNQEGGCCCFTESHTYRFAKGKVNKVIVKFDTGKKVNCRSKVKFDVHSDGRWVTLASFNAVSSEGSNTYAPRKVSVNVNRTIDGFRLGDGCICCIDSSEIWLQ